MWTFGIPSNHQKISRLCPHSLQIQEESTHIYVILLLMVLSGLEFFNVKNKGLKHFQLNRVIFDKLPPYPS